MSDLEQVVAGAGAADVVNENFQAVSPAGLYGRRPGSGGLSFSYYGGVLAGNIVADGAITLSASEATIYIVAAYADGAVSSSTSGTNWANTTDYLRIGIATTGTSTITGFVDHREAYGGSGGGGGGGGMTNPMTTAGDLIYGGTPSSGVAPPTRLAATTNGYVLTLASGLPTWAAASSGFSNPMTTVGDLIVGGTSGAAGRLAAGTSGYVLTSTGAGSAPSWQAAGGGGGLTNWTESINSSSPNATINVAQFLATGATTNIDAALTPKGPSGSILAHIPDASTTGGNKRGTQAVDLQMARSASTQVASGQQAVIFGARNTASGQNSVAIGDTNTSSGSYSGGFGGFSNTSSGYASVTMGGSSNTASGTRSATLGGSNLNTRSLDGMVAFGANAQSNGKAQGELYSFSRTTSDAVQRVATLDGTGTASATVQMVLNNNSAMVIQGQALVRNPTNGEVKSWDFAATVKRGANAAATSIIEQTVTARANESSISTAVLALAADTTNGAVQVQITGVASTTLLWHGNAIVAFVSS